MNETFMRQAIELARENARHGQGGPFGAVVVREGKVVGRGANRVTASNDPTAHAEVLAIREACAGLETFRLEDCAIYCSCEPCPMCLAAIYWSRIGKVYYAAQRQDAAQAGFSDEFIYQELHRPLGERQVKCEQMMRNEALRVLAEWQAKPDKKPY